MLRIAVPSVLQQSTRRTIGHDDRAGGCKSIRHTGARGLCGNDESGECVFSDFCIHPAMRFRRMFPRTLGQTKPGGSKQDTMPHRRWMRVLQCSAFIVIETLHTPISSLFLGKDGTALAYQVAGDYMKWSGVLFHLYGDQDGNRRRSARAWNYAAVSHCQYGKPCDSLVRCVDFCPAFWHSLCLACRAGRLVCKLFDFL